MVEQLVAALCVKLALAACPTIEYTKDLGDFYAEARLYNSGKTEILINRYRFDYQDDSSKKQILIHEMTHIKLIQEGDTKHRHNRTFYVRCRQHGGNAHYCSDGT